MCKVPSDIQTFFPPLGSSGLPVSPIITISQSRVFTSLFTRVLNSTGLKLTFMPRSSRSCFTITPIASRSVLPAFVKRSNSTWLPDLSRRCPFLSQTNPDFFRYSFAFSVLFGYGSSFLFRKIEFKLSAV